MEKKDNRTFLNDYSFDKNSICNIDMVLSGKYLDDRKLNINLNDIEIDEYPSEDKISELKELIAKLNKKRKENIILGAASNGIIQNLVKLFFSKGGTLLTSEFSFAQPEYAVLRIGGKVKKIPTDSNFKIKFENMLNNVDDDTKAIFLCNPNNPTGYYYEPSTIIDFAKKVTIPVIVSEAAIEFTEKESLLNYELPENIIVTRTFSKAYGLAGLRIGYAFLSGKYLELYNKNITRFEVSLLSIILAIDMIKNVSINKNIKLVLKEREYLQNNMNVIGIDTLASNSNAFMTKNMYHKDFFELLNNRGISVAKIDSNYNDYFYFRVAVQKPNVNKLFIEELKKFDLTVIRKYEKKLKVGDIL